MHMKKPFLLLIAAIMAASFAHAQNAWVTYKIDNRLSVKVPDQPKEINGGATMSMDNDSLIYLTILVDFVKSANIDSTALAPLLPTQEFADGLKTGMLSKMEGSTLGDVKIGKWNNYYCYNIEGENADKKLKLYTFLVVIGNNLYGLMVLVPDTKSSKGKDDFFNSLTLL
jgi:hypothetical protein